MADFESTEQRIRGLRDKKRMGDAFEHVVAHYLRHDPAVAFSEVWLWSDWLERLDLGLKGDQGSPGDGYRTRSDTVRTLHEV